MLHELRYHFVWYRSWRLLLVLARYYVFLSIIPDPLPGVKPVNQPLMRILKQEPPVRLGGSIPKYDIALQGRLILHEPQFRLNVLYLGSERHYGFIL